MASFIVFFKDCVSRRHVRRANDIQTSRAIDSEMRNIDVCDASKVIVQRLDGNFFGTTSPFDISPECCYKAVPAKPG